MSSALMDVIVVGCGAAGAAALSRLHAAGVKVLALEAGGSVGGRIRTEPFADGVVDLGAAWCHGEKDNVVFELANPHGLLGRPGPEHTWYMTSSGDQVHRDQAEDILQTLNKAVADADKTGKESISECVRNAAKSSFNLQKDPRLTGAFIEWFERNSHVGGQTDPKTGKSLRGLAECWSCEGEFLLNWKTRGYKTILDLLLNRYPDPTKELPVSIKTGKQVEYIKWRAGPGDSAQPLVFVKCRDGSLFAAKSVIVTVSLGVLKESHTTLFNPPLPQEKVTAIENLQFCVLDKIYIEFTKAWWPQSPGSFTILWREEDKAKFTEEQKWVTEVYGFTTIEYQPNVLLAWVYGEGARAMENASIGIVTAGVEKLLDTVFKKEFDVTSIKSIVRTQWASNEFARGAYAYRSVANEENGGDAVTLSEPLYHNKDFPIVCFAGEATSHHRHSAVHGAVESGYREADRLIESFARLK